jgi:hypothetical protein
VKSLGKDVLEEAAQKLLCGKAHGLPSELAAVLIAEEDLFICDGQDAVVGNGDAVDVAGEITQDLARVLESGPAMDNPVLLPDGFREDRLGQGLSGQLDELGPEQEGEGGSARGRRQGFSQPFLPDSGHGYKSWLSKRLCVQVTPGRSGYHTRPRAGGLRRHNDETCRRKLVGRDLPVFQRVDGSLDVGIFRCVHCSGA